MDVTVLKDIVVPLISVTTLLFTVGTFWWNNWRRGTLRAGIPRTFGAHQDAKTVRVLLPVAISNTGAIPIVVTALRLKIGEHSPVTLAWQATRPSMRLRGDETFEYAANFIVPGRASIVKCCEFVKRLPQDGQTVALQEGHNSVTLEALWEGRPQWVQIGEFELFVDPERDSDLRSAYLIWDNEHALPADA